MSSRAHLNDSALLIITFVTFGFGYFFILGRSSAVVSTKHVGLWEQLGGYVGTVDSAEGGNALELIDCGITPCIYVIAHYDRDGDKLNIWRLCCMFPHAELLELRQRTAIKRNTVTSKRRNFFMRLFSSQFRSTTVLEPISFYTAHSSVKNNTSGSCCKHFGAPKIAKMILICTLLEKMVNSHFK